MVAIIQLGSSGHALHYTGDSGSALSQARNMVYYFPMLPSTQAQGSGDWAIGINCCGPTCDWSEAMAHYPLYCAECVYSALLFFDVLKNVLLFFVVVVVLINVNNVHIRDPVTVV